MREFGNEIIRHRWIYFNILWFSHVLNYLRKYNSRRIAETTETLATKITKKLVLRRWRMPTWLKSEFLKPLGTFTLMSTLLHFWNEMKFPSGLDTMSVQFAPAEHSPNRILFWMKPAGIKLLDNDIVNCWKKAKYVSGTKTLWKYEWAFSLIKNKMKINNKNALQKSWKA